VTDREATSAVDTSAVDTLVLQSTIDELDGNATFREFIAVPVMGSQPKPNSRMQSWSCMCANTVTL